jgi:hypothetical protein
MGTCPYEENSVNGQKYILYYIKLCLKKRRQKNQRKLKPKILRIGMVQVPELKTDQEIICLWGTLMDYQIVCIDIRTRMALSIYNRFKMKLLK